MHSNESTMTPQSRLLYSHPKAWKDTDLGIIVKKFQQQWKKPSR